MGEYIDTVNIQPAYPSYKSKALEPVVRPSPTCSMLLKKKDLSVDAVCEWSLVQEDMTVSLIAMNKTVTERVFHQEIKMKSSFSSRLVGRNKFSASFTLNELSSNIMPLTCSTSREKENKQCRYPTMLEVKDDTNPATFVCKRKFAVQMDVLLIKGSNGQIIKINSNQSRTIERNMIDGDEIFVICGKETDDAIEVNRIATVKINQQSNCYTAEIEHKSDETVVTISSGCSPTYDNDDATTRAINTINMTEGGSTSSESQTNVIKQTRINTTHISTPRDICNEEKTRLNNGAFFYGVLASIGFVVLAFSSDVFLHRRPKMKEGKMQWRSSQSPVVKSMKGPGSTGVMRAEPDIPKRDISETREHRPPYLPPSSCIGSREREAMRGHPTAEHGERQRPPNPPEELQMGSGGNRSTDCTLHDADGSRVQLKIKDVSTPTRSKFLRNEETVYADRIYNTKPTNLPVLENLPILVSKLSCSDAYWLGDCQVDFSTDGLCDGGAYTNGVECYTTPKPSVIGSLAYAGLGTIFIVLAGAFAIHWIRIWTNPHITHSNLTEIVEDAPSSKKLPLT